jgi:peptidyl-prolyl cis-trans isomerase D
MESLRNFLTGPRLFIVIAACALPFVFLGTSSLGTTFENNLGSVNGEKITEADFQIASNIANQKFKNIYGDDFNFNELDENMQLDAIKQEVISQKVLLSQSKSLGLLNAETKKQAKMAIIRNPAFQIDGVFDEDIYGAQVNAAGHTKDSYIDLMTDMLSTETFTGAITSIGFITEKEIEDLAYLLEQSANIEFIKVDFNKLENQIVNTDDEIKSFYENNNPMFFSDEERSFNYFILSSEDYRSLVNVPDGYIEQSYQEYLNESKNRTQIRFAHIMIEKENHASNKDALDLIQDIKEKIDGGDDFSELAKIYSDDIVNKDLGGDLEYFDAEVFPVEFSMAIDGLNENETSEIVELEDTYHILKITELNEENTLSLDEMKDSIMNDLIDSESFALMNDALEIADDMIFSNNSFESIAKSLNKDISVSSGNTINNTNLEIKDYRINEYLFSPEAEIGTTISIDLDDFIVVMSLSDIQQPFLLDVKDVIEEVNNELSSKKADEKLMLLIGELEIAKNDNTLQSFIAAYDFISTDSFVDVKRFSSLLPQDVLSEVFEISSGNSKIINSRNGDVYLIDLINFSEPSEDIISDLLKEYEGFANEKNSKNLTSVINSDLFDSARVNFNNLVF